MTLYWIWPFHHVLSIFFLMFHLGSMKSRDSSQFVKAGGIEFWILTNFPNVHMYKTLGTACDTKPWQFLLYVVGEVEDIKKQVGPNDARDPNEVEPTGELGPPIGGLQLVGFLLPPSRVSEGVVDGSPSLNEAILYMVKQMLKMTTSLQQPETLQVPQSWCFSVGQAHLDSTAGWLLSCRPRGLRGTRG